MFKRLHKQNRISVRAIIIGSLLIPVACFWVTNSEMVTGVTEITSTALLIGAVFILFVLVLLNLLLEQFAPKYALSGAEMLIIYVMFTLAMNINGIGMFGFLTTALCNPYWYETPENSWSDFYPYIPDWFAPQSQDAIRDFYLGESSLYTKEHLSAWITPIATWSIFTLVLLFVMLCLNVILRRRWIDQEHLAFPIAVLPIEMSVRERRFSDYLKNRLLWIGFTVPVIIQSINSLQFHFPSLPYIKVKPFDIGYLFSTRPWNAIGWLPIAFHPCVIGLTYFIPLDVSFSCWFFYLFRKIERILAVVMGTSGTGAMSRFPAIAEQGTGAWIGLTLIALWIGRNHIFAALKSAFVLNSSSLDDQNEPLSYRLAFIGLFVGFSFLVFFAYFAGMTAWVAIAFFGLFFVYMIALTRIRAKGGVIWNFGPYINPVELLTRITGTRILGNTNLTVLAYLQWFNLDYRCAVMPHQLEGFKIGQAAKVNMRKLGYLIIWAVILGIISAYWNVLHMYYARGAATSNVNPWRINMGLIPYRRLRHWFDYPSSFDLSGINFIGGGILTVFFLSFMRSRFLWWIFHPIGYAVANTFIIDLIWMPMFVSWIIKAVIIRYGGLKMYRRGLPFFIGLILGDYVIACLWSIAGVILDIPMYRVFPN